jgi:DinB superfamily
MNASTQLAPALRADVVRAAVIGLLGFAAAEEQMLLVAAAAQDTEPGSAGRWAALPLVAHNTEFKSQQVQRLRAVRDGREPPAFAETDHRSAEVYQRYRAQDAATVAAASRQAAADLTAGLGAVTDEDLLDPARHPWLAGRQLWLQVVVRGFWHPAGHLGEYYLAHGQPGRAIALAEQAAGQAAYLGAPAAARGMACYNLACARAQAGAGDDALVALAEAVTLNPALRANARRDPDLAPLAGRDGFAVLLG